MSATLCIVGILNLNKYLSIQNSIVNGVTLYTFYCLKEVSCILNIYSYHGVFHGSVLFHGVTSIHKCMTVIDPNHFCEMSSQLK